MTRPERTASQAANFIVERLREAGFTALLAGGCVRDMLLSREPKDYDVATDAQPDQVGSLFPRARWVGAKFGVMLVRKFGHDVEVATFRTDGTYSDGRRPDDVTFGTAEDDARRRDFTINGLFYDPIERLVIDHVGGRADLQAGVVRTIGDPRERFAEDHLRMLRAVRFAALLGFEIDPATFEAIRQLAPQLRAISPERIWMELALMLGHTSRDRAWSLLTASGLCDWLVEDWKPEEARHDAIAERLRTLAGECVDAVAAFAAIMLDDPPHRVRSIARALRLSNQQSDDLCWLVQAVPQMRSDPDMELADLKMLMARDRWPDALALLRADLLTAASTSPTADPPQTPWGRLSARAAHILPEAVAPPPLLTGEDVIALGVQPGPQLGDVLRIVYRAQLNEQIATRAEAMALVKKEII